MAELITFQKNIVINLWNDKFFEWRSDKLLIKGKNIKRVSISLHCLKKHFPHLLVRHLRHFRVCWVEHSTFSYLLYSTLPHLHNILILMKIEVSIDRRFWFFYRTVQLLWIRQTDGRTKFFDFLKFFDFMLFQLKGWWSWAFLLALYFSSLWKMICKLLVLWLLYFDLKLSLLFDLWSGWKFLMMNVRLLR